MASAWPLCATAFFALSTFAFAACGGGSDAVAVAADAGIDANAPDGADSLDSASEGAIDAGADIEQDPNVYPAKHHPIPAVDNQGGPLLDHMTLVTVTFAGDANRDVFRQLGHTIGTSSWWHRALGGYGISDATAGPDVELPSTLPASMTDDDLKSYLKSQITRGSLPPPTAQTLYLVYVPRSTQITLPSLGSSCQAFDGYHGSLLVSLSSDGGVATIDAAYAVVDDCSGSLTEMTITASHEIAEAATDPNIQDTPSYYMYTCDAWELDLGGAGKAGEVGDLCSWLSWREGSFEVQRIYSNAAAAASKNPCQPWDKLYYGAAPRTTPKIVGGIRMDARLVVARGQSIDVILDAFSEAALPHDFSLYVGQNVGPGANGIQALGGGVSARLSKQSVHNGNGVVLTISASKSAPVGDVPFVVRSVLDTSDFNDWPLILTVK